MNDTGNTPSLPPNTSLGPVALTVADLPRSLAFYQDTLGFRLREHTDGSATLGTGEKSLLRLQERPAARRPERPFTGLYHFAILLPTRRDLARILHHLAQKSVRLQGAADHFVSEALYLADPDGNGIELYRDRPRNEWPYRGEQLQIGTAPLDIDSLLGERDGPGEPWAHLPGGTTIGHVHLQVSDLAAAEQFYRQIIGFDLIMHYGTSAAFLSAGGYHHHLGLNTWASAGAPPAPPGATGLRWYEIRLPTVTLDALLERARAADLAPEWRDDGWYLADPSQNLIRLTPR